MEGDRNNFLALETKPFPHLECISLASRELELMPFTALTTSMCVLEASTCKNLMPRTRPKDPKIYVFEKQRVA